MGFNVSVINTSGAPDTDPLICHASTTTASDGTWSIDISGVGYTNLFSVQAIVLSSDNTVANAGYTSVSTFSTSTVAGRAVKPQTVPALGGSPVQSIGSGRTVYITVIGN